MMKQNFFFSVLFNALITRSQGTILYLLNYVKLNYEAFVVMLLLEFKWLLQHLKSTKEKFMWNTILFTSRRM